MKNIAIFASGTGSNATRIVDYFADRADVSVALIVSNRAQAGVLAMATERGIATLVIDRPYFYTTEAIITELATHEIDFIVLAGFLWLVPAYLVDAFAKRIINIHPALLPRYGGRGMYGKHVHEAVKAAGDRETGMTIHWVDHAYDEGSIIFQARCAITPDDSVQDIAEKVLKLEHQYFSPTIDRLLQQQ